MSIKILIVDDHSVVRQGLKMFLALDADLEIVGDAQNGEEAIDLVKELRPDVVLMDLLMPVMDGITATRIIRQEYPDTEVIAITSVVEDALVVNAVRAGAIGYLLKDTEAEDAPRNMATANSSGNEPVYSRGSFVKTINSDPIVRTIPKDIGTVVHDKNAAQDQSSSFENRRKVAMFMMAEIDKEQLRLSILLVLLGAALTIFCLGVVILIVSTLGS